MAVLLIALLMQLAPAAPSPASQPSAPPDLRVTLVTFGPGDASFEKFGHNMIRIQDSARGVDASFNWGLFDFDSTFIFRFIQGKLNYSMAGFQSEPIIEDYRQQDRMIWEQELNLSHAQKQSLLDFCIWNQRPENRYYKYDYFIDNCSTRARDAIDAVLGGQIKAQSQKISSPHTYRSESQRLMADSLPLYVGIDFVLGRRIDQPMSAWDEMYIPMRMREGLNEVMIVDADGKSVPLVLKETILQNSTRPPERQSPPGWTIWFFLAGALFGGGIALLARSAAKGSRAARIAYFIATFLWCLLAGFAGWFLIYGWTLTDHVWVRGNENLLQLSPLLLPLVVLIPKSRKKPGVRKICLALAGLACAGSALGLMLKIVPGMMQDNANIIAMALPVNIGLLAGIWRMNQMGLMAGGGSTALERKTK